MKKYLLGTLSLAIIVGALFCFLRKNKKLEMMSPREIMNLYIKSQEAGDMETLRKIIVFPPTMTKEEIDKKLEHTVICDSEKFVRRMFLARTKTEYGKIIDDNTAEVGIIITGMWFLPFSKRVPFQQIVLKKENGIWKYHYSKFEISEDELLDMIKRKPSDPDAYYLLGMKCQAANPVRASKYYKKYIEIEPKGFWISKHLFELIKEYENLDEIEKRSARAALSCPPNSPNGITAYLSLAKMFLEAGDIAKAKMYLQKAEAVCKLVNSAPRKYPHPEVIRFYKEKKEIEEQMEKDEGVVEYGVPIRKND